MDVMILFKVVNLGYQFKVFLLLVFRHCWCLSETAPTLYLFYFFSFFFFHCYFDRLSINYKETKKLDKKELQRSRPTLARIFVGPTLTIQRKFY
jgi:hypothetical protein